MQQIKMLLNEYGIHPKKRFGQNFLVDRNILNKIVDACDIEPGSRVLEIGPGLGVVTHELAKRGAKIICVEADKDFEPILRGSFGYYKDIEFVFADFLKVDMDEVLSIPPTPLLQGGISGNNSNPPTPLLQGGTTEKKINPPAPFSKGELDQLPATTDNSPATTANTPVTNNNRLSNDRLPNEKRFTAVGNLPYYITTPIIIKLIENKHLIKSIIMMVQKEVADRLMAASGSDEFGSISVFVQYHCKIERVAKVSRNVFFPPPDVDSAVIKLTILDEPRVKVNDEKLFFKIVRASFGKRRKTLHNSLGSSDNLGWNKEKSAKALELAKIDPNRRGETLSLEEFGRIVDASENC